MNAAQDVEEMAQRLGRMESQNAEMVRTLRQHQQALRRQTKRRSEADEAGLLETGRQVAALRVSDSTSVPLGVRVRSAVDTRTLDKHHSFSGRRKDWRKPRFVLEASA